MWLRHSVPTFFPQPLSQRQICEMFKDCWCLDSFFSCSQIAHSICVIASLLVSFQTVCLVSSLVLLETPNSIWLLSFSCLYLTTSQSFTDSSSVYCFSCETQGVMHPSLYVLLWLTLCRQDIHSIWRVQMQKPLNAIWNFLL